jgi:DNA-binding transcriptional MerR regulator
MQTPTINFATIEQSYALQVFQAAPVTVYPLETTAEIVDIPRRLILLYCKHGLVCPIGDPTAAGYYFDDEGIRALRRIEYLRNVHGINLPGIKMILALTEQLERLRADFRLRR